MPKLWKRYNRLHNLTLQEEGQDLVEYTMLIALIASATTAAMQTVAADVHAVFTSISSILTNAVG